MEKQQFKYSGSTPNGPISGTLWALNADEAAAIARRMGVANPAIEDSLAPKAIKIDPPLEATTIPATATSFTPFNVAPATNGPLMMFPQQAGIHVVPGATAPYNPAPSPATPEQTQEERILAAVQPKMPIPATMVSSLSSEQKTQIMAHVDVENVGPNMKPISKEDPAIAAMLREIVMGPTRQELFIDQRNDILEQVNAVLKNKAGRVVSTAMHPDGQGRIVYAVVVEYSCAKSAKE